MTKKPNKGASLKLHTFAGMELRGRVSGGKWLRCWTLDYVAHFVRKDIKTQLILRATKVGANKDCCECELNFWRFHCFNYLDPPFDFTFLKVPRKIFISAQTFRTNPTEERKLFLNVSSTFQLKQNSVTSRHRFSLSAAGYASHLPSSATLQAAKGNPWA